MTDLTDAVQTLVSLIGDSSSGIGTTGYEITDDDDNSLTISGNQILISYTMGKEELKEQFGGSQDFDVVITLKSGEITDEYIGLSNKQYVEEIIITVNIIDKWSAVGSGNKYVTAHLVREKAINAIRKFVKDYYSPIGEGYGTVNIWKFIGVDKEEDTSFKPTLYKAMIKTEAWSYY